MKNLEIINSFGVGVKIKKGDKVLIISGKDKGKTGSVLRSFPQKGKILVEAINVKQKHVKPKKQGEKGQVVKISAPLDISNVKFICPKCGKATRLGYKIAQENLAGKTSFSNGARKFRICKKCKSEV